MLTVKTPKQYISEPGVLSKAGGLIAAYGHSLYVLGSKTSFAKTLETLRASFDAASLSYTLSEFQGYPTDVNFQKHLVEAQQAGTDLIVGVGGGRVCDTAKVVAAKLGLPCVTIPTVAATCAAWAALSIVYNGEGGVLYAAFNPDSPRLVIADTQIILDAPPRYLKAGIMDTLAKWYETAPNAKAVQGDITLQQSALTAKLAYDTLTENLNKIIQDIEQHQVTSESRAAVDAVIYLAGLSGSLTEEQYYGGFAHGFYNSVSHVKSTRGKLHGERVAFGLLIQFILEEKSKRELDRELDFFVKLQQPLTLEQIGITENVDEALQSMVPDILNFITFVRHLKGNPRLRELARVIREADEVGRQYYT